MSAAAASFGIDSGRDDVIARRVPYSGGDVLAFVVPLLLFVQLNRVGRLFGGELVLLALLPFLLHRHLSQIRRWTIPALPVVLLLVWLDGQVMSDLYRGTPFTDYARGWSKILFTLINFVAMFLLFDGRARRYLLFGTGLAVGLVLEYFLAPTAYATAEPWKFGFAMPVTLLLALAATSQRAQAVRLLSPALFATGAVVNLLNGYRSMAGICFLAAVYLALRGRRVGLAPATRRGSGRSPGMLLALVVAAVGFTSIYAYAASTGRLGLAARAKYAQQSGGAVSILQKGRPEFRVGLSAALDSPLLGHGSWAKNPQYVRKLESFGYHPTILELQNDPIPSHSHLIGAWVEAGVLGLPFWGWTIMLVAGAVSTLVRSRDVLVPLATFAALWLAWDIFFSPYAAEGRVYTPYFLLVLLFVRERSRRKAIA
jgi:hypothetical protein